MNANYLIETADVRLYFIIPLESNEVKEALRAIEIGNFQT